MIYLGLNSVLVPAKLNLQPQQKGNIAKKKMEPDGAKVSFQWTVLFFSSSQNVSYCHKAQKTNPRVVPISIITLETV